jgi:hypothetical protein
MSWSALVGMDRRAAAVLGPARAIAGAARNTVARAADVIRIRPDICTLLSLNGRAARPVVCHPWRAP